LTTWNLGETVTVSIWPPSIRMVFYIHYIDAGTGCQDQRFSAARLTTMRVPVVADFSHCRKIGDIISQVGLPISHGVHEMQLDACEARQGR